MVRDTLYFGRNKPAGGIVGDTEWHRFLTEVITPRFPAGLSIVEATGQWSGPGGNIEQENSKIVTIFHSDDTNANQEIMAISSEYKRRFNQEAVLREQQTACVSF